MKKLNSQLRSDFESIGGYEPKRINQFKVIFPEELSIEPWAIKSITKPLFA